MSVHVCDRDVWICTQHRPHKLECIEHNLVAWVVRHADITINESRRKQLQAFREILIFVELDERVLCRNAHGIIFVVQHPAKILDELVIKHDIRKLMDLGTCVGNKQKLHQEKGVVSRIAYLAK